MTTHTCAVRCRVLSPSGAPVAAARIVARLSHADLGVDGYVVPAVVTVVTDGNGLAILHLWPNALGATASHYDITIRAPDNGFVSLIATVPDVASADLEAIANLPAYPGKSESQLAIDGAQASAAAAALSAAAAQTGAAAAQAVIAQLASQVVSLEAQLAAHLTQQG